MLLFLLKRIMICKTSILFHFDYFYFLILPFIECSTNYMLTEFKQSFYNICGLHLGEINVNSNKRNESVSVILSYRTA